MTKPAEVLTLFGPPGHQDERGRVHSQTAVSTRSKTCWCAAIMSAGSAATALDSAVVATVAARPSRVAPP